jgi:hypothetical protein
MCYAAVPRNVRSRFARGLLSVHPSSCSDLCAHETNILHEHMIFTSSNLLINIQYRDSLMSSIDKAYLSSAGLPDVYFVLIRVLKANICHKSTCFRIAKRPLRCRTMDVRAEGGFPAPKPPKVRQKPLPMSSSNHNHKPSLLE